MGVVGVAPYCDQGRLLGVDDIIPSVPVLLSSPCLSGGPLAAADVSHVVAMWQEPLGIAARLPHREDICPSQVPLPSFRRRYRRPSMGRARPARQRHRSGVQMPSKPCQYQHQRGGHAVAPAGAVRQRGRMAGEGLQKCPAASACQAQVHRLGARSGLGSNDDHQSSLPCLCGYLQC